MKVCVLGSGSSGNSVFLDTGNTCILVDLGFGPRSLSRRLGQVGLQNPQIDAILLTHGHADHTCGVGPFLSKHPVPVFTGEGTFQEVPFLEGFEKSQVCEPGQAFTVGDFTIVPFATSHDAAQPFGFQLQCNGVQGAVATDLGVISADVSDRLNGSDWLILESNHDEQLLKVGPYPLQLKHRVLSSKGHLSNSAVARFLERDFDGHAGNIFLAHLSRQNNHPDIALESARRALMGRRHALFESCKLHLTHQAKPSIVLDL